MIRRPPRSTRTDTLFPYTTLFRSFKTITIEPTFAGIKVDFENEAEANVVITVLAADSIGDMQIADRVYTKAIDGQFATRGFQPELRRFGVFVRDRWDNRSDTRSEEHTSELQ